MAAADTKVKEDLSRMKGAYGEKMIKKLKNMKVAVFGLRGAGIETAKNLLLAGPHTVMVHDDEKVKIEDLGTNFYLKESDVGKSRAEGSSQELRDINPNTYFSVHTGPVDTELLSGYSTVIFTELQAQWPMSKLVEFDAFCAKNGVKFIWTGIMGMHMAVFSDFGKNHEIFDTNGAPEKSIVITGVESCPAPYEKIEEFLEVHLPKFFDIKKMSYGNKKEWGVKLLEEKLGMKFDAKRKRSIQNREILDIAESNEKTQNQGKVATKITTEGARHLLSSGEWLKLEEIIMEKEGKEGKELKYEYGQEVENVNSLCQIKVHRSNPRVFYIGDTSKLGAYKNGGIGNQKKMSVYKDYGTLAEQLYNPQMEMNVQNFACAMSKFGGEVKLHLGLLAIMKFHEDKKAYPRLMNDDDAKAVVEIAKKIKEEKKLYFEVDEKLISKMAKFSTTETNAIAAINGGIVAQEAMKQTGKYSPISQWMHFDAFELSENTEPLEGKATRYSHYEALFGKDFVSTAHTSKFFLVGCGALGCEFLKNIAMLGLGSKGRITITDDDVIELSNLSRQFLFRRKHVGKLKSESSAGVVVEMNPELKNGMDVRKARVEPKTENLFNCKFWDDIDFVINALDNLKARVYMDGKCILHKKVLFESGTLGTQANSSVHIPHFTPSYAEGAPPGEGQGIAMCTLTQFPYEPVHCIEWSRAMFGNMFEDGPAAYMDMKNEGVEKFLEKVDGGDLTEGLTKLDNALKWAKLAQNAELKTCVKLSLDMYVTEYRDKVLDLIDNFPEDLKTKAGLPFWRGRKRFPVAQKVDPEYPVFQQFIWHTSCIFADVFGLVKNGEYPTMKETTELAAGFPVDKWVKKKVDVDEEGNEIKKTGLGQEELETLDKLKAEAKKFDVSKLPKVFPADFEKDDDTNHHIDWITSSSNLRADTRRIKRSERHECRMVAGRIIAAIATTTASITGFVFLELYKKLLGKKDVNDFNWATINLATNVLVYEMPADPKEKRSRKEYTTEIENNTTYKVEKNITCVPNKFTCYDFIDIKGDLNVAEFCKAFTEHKSIQGGLVVQDILAGKGVLYSATDVSVYEKKKAKAIQRVENAKNPKLKKMFQKNVDSAQAFIDSIKSQGKKKIFETYIKEAGPLVDPDQPFIVLDVLAKVDPTLPQWIKNLLPKAEKLKRTVDIEIPKVRLWYK